MNDDQFTDAALLAEDNDRLRAELRRVHTPNRTIFTPTFVLLCWFIGIAGFTYRFAIETQRRHDDLSHHLRQMDRETEWAQAETMRATVQAIERENEHTREMVKTLGRRLKP